MPDRPVDLFHRLGKPCAKGLERGAGAVDKLCMHSSEVRCKSSENIGTGLSPPMAL